MDPDPGGQGRPKGPSRVHGRAGEVATGEGVGADDEAGEQRADRADRAPRVEDHRIGDEEEGEGEDHLHHQALRGADACAKGMHRGNLHCTVWRMFCLALEINNTESHVEVQDASFPISFCLLFTFFLKNCMLHGPFC
uniref:Tip4b n=1 Tax=Arundo donax TaxID=35708 RepID=A0A0A9A2Y7_ARUDO